MSNSLGFPFASSSTLPLPPSVPDHLQAKPQYQEPTSAFSMDGKGFNAGDVSAPFDLPLLPFNNDTIAFPAYQLGPASSSSLPLGQGIDPIALNSSLSSPLSISQEHSPWSELLASPMFSLPNSEPTTTRLPELPLPPFNPSFDASGSLFPPLDTSFYVPTDPSTSTSTSTTFRPLPPLPTRPGVAPVQRPSPTSSTSSLPSNSQDSIKRSEPTGFRTTIPLLGPEAPIQTRKDPVLPSSTTRKRKTAAAEKALAKRGRLSASPPVDTPAPSAVPTDLVTGVEGEEELPADIVAAIERKRLQNTMSARKSRARKQKKMQELEDENKALMDENNLLKAQLAAILGTQ